MREIKFRFWDSENKVMIEPYSIFDIVSHKYLLKEFLMFPISKEKKIEEVIIPLQYIGIKDNYGTEIYEGDIIRLENGEKFNIRWLSDKFCFESFLEIKREKRHEDINRRRWIPLDDIANIIDEVNDELENETLYGEEPIFSKQAKVKVIGNIYENPELMEDE